MNLAKGLSNRNVSSGKISFRLRRTNIPKATIHWTQDFRRISPAPSLTDIINAAEFCTEIEAARQRDRIRKHSLEELASPSKAADPGKLKGHTDWVTWSRSLNNYLLTIIGQDRFTLSYVIGESEVPDYTI